MQTKQSPVYVSGASKKKKNFSYTVIHHFSVTCKPCYVGTSKQFMNSNESSPQYSIFYLKVC